MDRSGPGRGVDDDDLSVQLRWGDAGAERELEPEPTPGPDAPGLARVQPAHMIRSEGDEDPQLRLIHEALTAVRAEVADLRAAVEDRSPSGRGESGVPADAVLEELASLRAEIVALKRRLAVRAAAGTTDRSAEDADLIARLVAERLVGWADRPTSGT